jgi:meso-butanediol dehydrogenase / (S,S)-butanediol dehydrogenase / diacetyl reductase
MAGRLESKTALITGTARGMGQAAAIRFAAEGARVVGCDVDEQGAKETVELVVGAGGEMVSLAPINIGVEDEVRRWIDFAVESYGDFDILYNNAAGGRFGEVDSFSREDWDYTLTNELTVVFLAIKYAVPVMKRKGGGCILNVGSNSALYSNGSIGSNLPGGFAHCAAKAGVIAMSRALAVDLSPYNIRVNSISPGATETPSTAPLFDGPAGDLLTRPQLIQRRGQPADVIAGAVYLTSDEASFVTGTNLLVDGGTVASGGAGLPGTAFKEEAANAAFEVQFN